MVKEYENQFRLWFAKFIAQTQKLDYESVCKKAFMAGWQAAQQSVQWIGGDSAPSQAESTPELNPLAEVDQLPPAAHRPPTANARPLGAYMKYFEEVERRNEKEIVLLADDRVLAIFKDGDTVTFRQNCDEYFFATFTKEEAIELLKEAIAYIERT